MIRSITRQKSMEEIERLLGDYTRVFIIGCGTCVTLCRTGGLPEVLQMKEQLEAANRLVTGYLILPVACDEITQEILAANQSVISEAQALLIMTCAFGVQTVATRMETTVIPALDTLFIGKERGLGEFHEVCTQCGTCIIGETGGICPVTTCHKGLVNGPCGGTKDGKCEIDPQKDCAWTLIYQRLKGLGNIDLMRRYQGPRNHQVVPHPGAFSVPREERSI
ncbi:MAG: methylenetetrahydrofolate reductase C-terminal domain-containing protein [Syntrophales bacterium]